MTIPSLSTIGFHQTVSFLTQSSVKKIVKAIFGCLSFAFGIYELKQTIGELTGKLDNRLKKPVKDEASKSWQKTANKMIAVITQVSLICSIFTSRPGLSLLGIALGCVNQKCHRRTPSRHVPAFVRNPYHPRHVLTIATALLGIPTTVKIIYELGVSAINQIKNLFNSRLVNSDQTDAPYEAELLKKRVKVILWMGFINTLISRPVLHLTAFLLKKKCSNSLNT